MIVLSHLPSKTKFLGITTVETVGGKKQPMRVKYGPVTCHPVPVKPTAEYIMDQNLYTATVEVRSPLGNFEPCTIDLNDVRHALELLCEINPFYKDIITVFKNSLQDEPAAEKSLLTRASHAENQVAISKETGLEVLYMREHAWDTLNFDTKDLDVQAFPWLFQDGKNGVNEVRETPLTRIQFIRRLLTMKNRKFARDFLWIIFNVGFEENKQITQICGLAVRKATKHLTTADWKRMQDSSKFSDMVCFSSTFLPLRGYLPYWQNVRNRVISNCKAIGPAQIFLTLNPDVTRWIDLHEIYQKVTGKKIDETNIREAIDEDCVPFSIYFHSKLKLTMKFIKKEQLFGPMMNSFYRVEYQKIGYQHAHCLFWLESTFIYPTSTE